MIICPPELPQKLRIWQQNVHKSKTAHSYLINTANPKDWNILALQEPWIDSYGNSHGSQYWRVIYPANFYEEDRTRVRSILLVNTNISTDCYIPLLIPHSDITALRFKGDNRFLSVFNIYNEITNNDTLRALDLFYDHNNRVIRPTDSDGVLWLGDFNRHHPMWEDDANERLFESEEYITPLINLLYKQDMLLALPKGIPTLQMAAGNWTRPDNVWRCNTPEDPIQRCDTAPTIHPPLADHLLIITILDLPMPRLSSPPTLNFRMADWNRVSSALGPRLEAETPAMCITSKEEFLKKVDDVVRIVDEVLHEQIDEKSPNPYKQRWWTEELSHLKKAQNRLSNKSHRFRHVRDHPAHTEYKVAANKFKEVMLETRNQDWVDWLEGASQQDLYLANKYISSKPSDYSNAHIPALHIHTNGLPDLAEDNEQKVKALASSFFPPPPITSSVPPHQEYLTPLKGPRYFSRDRICQVIHTLSPFKAPGLDKSPTSYS